MELDHSGRNLTYADKVTLVSWRPFKGTFVDTDHAHSGTTTVSKDSQLQKDENHEIRQGRELDTSGLDSMLTLMRALTAYGFPRFYPISPEADHLLQVALGTLGDEKSPDSDRRLKGKLIKTIFPNASLQNLQKNPFTFENWMEKLPEIVKTHEYFRLCGSQAIVIKTEAGLHGKKEPLEPDYICEVQWNNPGHTLQQCIDEKFKKHPDGYGGYSQLIADYSHFLRVRKSGPFNFMNVRDVELRASFTSHISSESTEKTTYYKLIAIIRLADTSKGVEDRIRIYNMDYTEVASRFFKEEKFDSVRKAKIWTTKENYDFLLFYVLLTNKADEPCKEGWPAGKLFPNSPEYFPFDCNKQLIPLEDQSRVSHQDKAMITMAENGVKVKVEGDTDIPVSDGPSNFVSSNSKSLVSGESSFESHSSSKPSIAHGLSVPRDHSLPDLEMIDFNTDTARPSAVFSFWKDALQSRKSLIWLSPWLDTIKNGVISESFPQNNNMYLGWLDMMIHQLCAKWKKGDAPLSESDYNQLMRWFIQFYNYGLIESRSE